MILDALLNLQGLIGLAIVLLVAWAISEDRAVRPGWLWIGGARALQFVIALVVTLVPFVWTLADYANSAVSAIERATLVGSSYMFGYTGGAPIPFVLKPGADEPVIVAFQILPLIIVFSAIAALLWHWGILRAAVRELSWAMRKTLGVSGVVGLGAGSTIFLGVVESPLVLKAWFARMTRSDLFAIVVLIMATISGAILVLYATTLSQTVPNAVGHMIVASLISLPAAVLVARLMVPPVVGTTPDEETADEPEAGLKYESSMDALIRGTADGVTLVLAVLGIIIVIFALVNIADQILFLSPGSMERRSPCSASSAGCSRPPCGLSECHGTRPLRRAVSWAPRRSSTNMSPPWNSPGFQPARSIRALC